MITPRPKAQHFVPRFYLANFVDEKGLVWTYDPISDAVRAATPEKTAIETNFYSVIDKDGNYRERNRKLTFRRREQGGRPLRESPSGEVLQGQEKADFAVFVSSLFARSPSQINYAAEM